MKSLKENLFLLCCVISFPIAFCSCEIWAEFLEDGEADAAQTNINDGLVYYSTFDDGTSKNVLSNASLNGVFVNSPKLIDDTPNGIGKAVALNGFKDEGVLIPGNPVGNTKNYAMSMWIKDFSSGCIVHGVDDRNRYTTLSFIANAENRFEFCSSYYTEHVFSNYDYTLVQNGIWHMLTINIIYDAKERDRQVQLYVDGVLVEIAVGHERTDDDFPVKVRIGGGNDIVNNFKFDNLRFYNRSLTAEEVKAIYDIEGK